MGRASRPLAQSLLWRNGEAGAGADPPGLAAPRGKRRSHSPPSPPGVHVASCT